MPLGFRQIRAKMCVSVHVSESESERERETALWQGDRMLRSPAARHRAGQEGVGPHSPIWQEDTSTLPLSRSPRGLFSVISCWAHGEREDEEKQAHGKVRGLLYPTFLSELNQISQIHFSTNRLCVCARALVCLCAGMLTARSGSAADGLISST